MKKIIYFLFLIGTTVLVSFRGGNISYLLFYFALLLPILALAYSLYVYFRFKISQEVTRTVTKGVEVPYRLILANEDFIPFTNITLHYYTDMVTITENPDTTNLSLLSHEKIFVDTKMYCKYRGTYPVGVKSVSVTDFFGLFTITYPMRTQVRLTARPRILPLEILKADLEKKDPKNTLFSVSKLQNLPDYELRSYHSGDSLKYIHWKNSARSGELLVRKQMPEELFETVILMDLSPIEENPEIRLKTEDNILEAAIAFVHDYYLKKIPVRVIYMEDKLKEILIDTGTGFDTFYELCTNISFSSAFPLEKVWLAYISQALHHHNAILITSKQTSSLIQNMEESRMAGNKVILINTGELSI